MEIVLKISEDKVPLVRITLAVSVIETVKKDEGKVKGFEKVIKNLVKD